MGFFRFLKFFGICDDLYGSGCLVGKKFSLFFGGSRKENDDYSINLKWVFVYFFNFIILQVLI